MFLKYAWRVCMCTFNIEREIMPKFNLMSYIMPPEDKMFFTYFQDSAEICQKTARLYDKIMHDHLNDEYKEKALKYKKKGKLSYKAVTGLKAGFTLPKQRSYAP